MAGFRERSPRESQAFIKDYFEGNIRLTRPLNTGRKIFLATSKENASNNSIAGYANCASMFPRFKNMTKNEVANLVARRVEEHRILSFTQLAHLLDLYRGLRDKTRARRSLLQNAVLIMDEVQNLFSPPSGQANEYRTLLEFLEKPTEDNRGLYMVILSGTPGRNEEEIYRLLTMIKGKPVYPESPLRSSEAFVLSSTTPGTRPCTPRRTGHVALRRNEPRTTQLVGSKVTRGAPDLESRQVFVRGAASHELPQHAPVVASYAKSHLDVLSPKIACIVKEILDHPKEKHYLYSAFNAYGIKYVATILEAEGYKPLRMYGEAPDSEGKRYVMLGSDSVPTTDSALKHVMSVYNSDANAQGQLLHVVLARKKFNEGLDLKSVRHIHIMEPLLDVNAERQAIARAVRHCSHLQLDKKEWTVTVHRYITIDGVDDRVTERAHKENESEGVSIYMEKLRRLRKTRRPPAGHNLKESFKADLESIKAIAKVLMVDRESAYGMLKDTSKAVSDASVTEEVQDAIKGVEIITGYGKKPIRQLVLEGYWLA
eukprot:jgi/Mesvir1/694/Mv17306-RA.1